MNTFNQVLTQYNIKLEIWYLSPRTEKQMPEFPAK